MNPPPFSENNPVDLPQDQALLIERAERARGLVLESIALIDHLEAQHADTWRPLECTVTGQYLVAKARPQLGVMAGLMREQLEILKTGEPLLESFDHIEAWSLFQLRLIYSNLDHAEAELANE